MKRFFTLDYVERATLRDGTQVVLRLLAPEDTELLRRGFDKLSPESRYARFLVPKARLTDDELQYLCAIDQETHFALGALREDDGEGAGIARFIALAEPGVAEAAIAVADDMQHKGLGRLLFTRLVEAAAERGITKFHCDVLCSNASMKSLLDEIAPSHVVDVGSGVMSLELALPDTGPAYRLLRAAAQRRFV